MYIDESSFRRDSNNFDFLRLLGAFLVFYTHSFGDNEFLYRITNRAYNIGTWGMYTFITLSGFLLCRSITKMPVRYFLWNRFLRLCPAIAVCSILTAFIPGWIFTTLPDKAYFSHPETWYFILQNSFPVRMVMSLPGVFNGKAINASLWTIPLEIKFYALLIVGAISGILNKRLILAILWLSLLLLNTIFNKEVKSLDGMLNHFHSLAYLGVFFFGGVVFYLYREKIPMRFSIWLLFLAAWLLTWKFYAPYVQIPAAFFFIYTIIGIGTSKIRIPFPHADISYGFYLYAYPVQSSIHYAWGDVLSFWQYFFLSLLIIIALATASWFLIEKKALALKIHRRPFPAEQLVTQPKD
jgi:peptidoglycan/LPS O-acetylase OafA/YrhL